jgi:hypothetical protein
METDAACAPVLPTALQERIIALLVADDARDACAAACVSTAWARAAAAPAAWRALRLVSPHATRMQPLTDARLAALVARAAGGLTTLDVSGCVALSDAGIATALAGQPLQRVKLCRALGAPRHLLPPQKYDFNEGCYYDLPKAKDAAASLPHANDRVLRGPTQLTARGIAAALRGAAPLEELCVAGFRQTGVHAPDFDPDDADAGAQQDLTTLLPLVGGDAERLDVVLCGAEGYLAVWSRAVCEDSRTSSWCVEVPEADVQERCGCLLPRDQAEEAKQCQSCQVAYCAHFGAAADIQKCGCWQQMCGQCRENCGADEF